MRYIVVDLEWNNAFSPKSKKAINEIIEIGAVKLDENLAIKDTISTFIRPSVGKKLSKRVVEMTNITDKTTPRLIQFHTLKNAANPPFLGGFSIFGTVAA